MQQQSKLGIGILAFLLQVADDRGKNAVDLRIVYGHGEHPVGNENEFVKHLANR